jgi:hypothetical protein
MVKPVEAALHLGNHCLLLCNLFEALGSLCKRFSLCLNDLTLHLFCHNESPYVLSDFLGTHMEASALLL